MSTRKKVVPPLPQNKASELLIDPSLMGEFRKKKKSPLDDELEAEDAMVARELRDLRIEEIIERRKQRIAKSKKEREEIEEDEGKSLKGKRAPGISLNMARQISKLPADEQEKVMQTYAVFRNIDDPVDRGSLLLPMLVGYAKTNPGAPQEQMSLWAKTMTDNLKLGVDLAKTALGPQQQQQNPVEYWKLISELFKESVKQPISELTKQLQPQQNTFEQMILNPEIYSRMKTIFGSSEPKAGSTNIDFEIEKLRGERELSLKKMDLEWQKSMLEMQAKERRTDTIMQALTPMSALFANPVNERMRELGRKTASNPNPNYVPPTIPDNILRIQCAACGYDETKTFKGPPPPKITCPGCGAELLIGGPQTGNA